MKENNSLNINNPKLHDSLLFIFTMLSLEELVLATQVCKDWKEGINSSNHLWSYHLLILTKSMICHQPSKEECRRAREKLIRLICLNKKIDDGLIRRSSNEKKLLQLAEKKYDIQKFQQRELNGRYQMSPGAFFEPSCSSSNGGNLFMLSIKMKLLVFKNKKIENKHTKYKDRAETILKS